MLSHSTGQGTHEQNMPPWPYRLTTRNSLSHMSIAKPEQHRRRARPAYPVRDLSYVTALGARTRRHKYLRDIRFFFWPVLSTAFLQAMIYGYVITRPGRTD